MAAESMSNEPMGEALEKIFAYAEMLTDHTLENVENLSESTDPNFAALVLHAAVINMLIMNCKLEYERRGYKDLEVIVFAISDAVREALTDCKPTTH